MNSVLKSLGLLAAVTFAGSALADDPLRYYSFRSEGANYHVIVADLESQLISVEAVHSNHLQNFWNLTHDERPAAAITGTFFDPRTADPIADVLIDGKLVASGHRGSVIAADWGGKCHIFDSEWQQSIDWSQYRYALRGAVRLLRDGKVCPDPGSQKFHDPSIWHRAARTAAGITEDGRLVLMATSNPVYLSQIGRAIKTREVVDAVSLDGGSSTCLYYQGDIKIAPKRKLSNLLVLRQQSSTATYTGVTTSSWHQER